MCTSLFPKYCYKSHFLIGNELHVYKGGNLSHEDLYLKKSTICFIKELGYPVSITPRDEASRKHLKRIIDTHLLVDACIKDGRKVIFGISLMHLVSSLPTRLFIIFLLW